MLFPGWLKAYIVVMVALAHPLVGATPAAAHPCPRPTAAPWRMAPDRCYVVRPGHSVHLPRAATEADVWSRDGRVHLRQDVAMKLRCGWQYGFSAPGRYSAGWDTCNRDVHVYGRRVLRVYVWFS